MAKEKRSVADLDAELAALEAELAALEGKKPASRKEAPKPAAPAPRAPEPAPEAEAPAPAPERKSRFGFGRGKETREVAPAPASVPEPQEAPPAPAAPAERRKLGIPSFGRKKGAGPAEPAALPPPVEEEPAPLVEETRLEPPAAPAPARSAREAPPPIPVTDPTPWRQEGDAWVRSAPGRKPRIVRRILDEEDRLVREEPATERDLRGDDEGPAEPDAPPAGDGDKAKASLGRLFRRKG